MLRRTLAGCLILGLPYMAQAADEGNNFAADFTNSVSDGLTDNVAVDAVKDAFGFVKESTKKVMGLKDVPIRIAVMPATGEGNEAEKHDISNAIHNNLGTSQFNLLKPHQLEHGLKRLESQRGQSYLSMNADEIADALRVDGLLWIDVDKVDKVYAGAYAHYEFVVSARLFSAKDRKEIWKHQDSIIERDGGVSLNPIGIIATAVTSAKVLSEATRLKLIDQLARKFASVIPEPNTGSSIKPPAIQLAVSNGADGPFRAGDEVQVLMEAEPDLLASFTLSGRQPIEMQEQTSGNYIGRYVVKQGDALNDGVIEVKAVRTSDKTETLWRLSGRIGLDTQPPVQLASLENLPQQDGVQLSWKAQDDSGSEISYGIERADVQDGVYHSVADASINRFIDKNVETNHTYVYRVTPRDAAGNQGSSATTTAAIVPPGPTTISGDILTSQVWSALGSPYQISGKVTLGPAARLQILPGTLIEFAPGSQLNVVGNLQLNGTESAPVVLNGDDFRVSLTSSKVSQPWRWVKSHGQGGKLELKQSTLEISDSQFAGLAIAVTNSSLLTLTRSRVDDAPVAIMVNRAQLRLNDSRLTDNGTALQIGQISRTPIIHADKSRLARNKVHLSSASPVTIAGLALEEPDFGSAIAKLEGPVTIDWQSLEKSDNLELGWLGERWMKIVPLLEQHKWAEARNLMPDGHGKDLKQLLGWMASGKIPAREPQDDFLYPAYEALKQKRELDIWVQNVQVPSGNGLMSSDAIVLKQAKSRFTRSYLNARYGNKRRKPAFAKAQKLPMHQALISSRIAYRLQEGLTTTISVLHALDRKKLEHHLSVAGLIQRDQSNMLVAVAIDGENSHPLKNRLFQVLEQQNIQFIDLSTTASNKRRQVAQKRKADLLLSARLLASSSESSLTKSLKVVQADLNMKLISVQDGKVVSNQRRDARVTAFKTSDGINKAVDKTFGSMQERLLMQMYSAQ
ncbi:fibronectin type III domain-containing protein [Marinobacterium jannaschii]|uniref:fibronectin type III domain-containing protein n=1 Tax=Marinobacterium jannaschii TaxID=64970 RepID=UPI0004815A18|nr:fibronectin type III domain-containing protein [Marinobacterium jannaschii]